MAHNFNTIEGTETIMVNDPVQGSHVVTLNSIKSFINSNPQQIIETLLSSVWVLDGNYYKYTYINSIISEETIVDVIPRNSTIDIVISAGILPEVITFDGGFYLYAQYLPYEDFDVIINIFS